MKLTKAIEILTYYCSKDSHCYDPDLYDSVELGIEALKREQAKRTQLLGLTIAPLPGETMGDTNETH